MNREAIQDLLDRYFRGEASEVEIEQINQLKKTDSDFNKTFSEHQLLVKGIQEFREQNLRKKLKETLQKNQENSIQKEKKITFFNRRNFGIAAAILILLVASLGIYRNATFYERIYAAATPDRLEVIKMGIEDNTDSLHQENFRRYVKGFELSRINDFESSIDTLKSVSPEAELYYFYAQYEIALVYLLEKNDVAAIEQLKYLLALEGEHIAKDKAEVLLEKLENKDWF